MTTAGTLRDDATGVSVDVPAGWSSVDDVGGLLCEAPRGQADVTGRTAAAQVRIETAVPTATVPRVGLGSAQGEVLALARTGVADALAADPRAVLLDARLWTVRTAGGGTVEAVRTDLAHHDMTTPMVTTTILLRAGAPGGAGVAGGAAATSAGLGYWARADGGSGELVRVSASVPVAHHRTVADAVEQALGSLVVADGASSVTGAVEVAAWNTAADLAARSVVPAADLDVFLRGSHKIAPRWRPAVVAVGLAAENGTATSMGHYVRRAMSRPDLRVGFQLTGPDGSEAAMLAVDRLEGHAVLTLTAPGYLGLPTTGPGGTTLPLGFEVLDVAAVPARVASWLGVGRAAPGRAFPLTPGSTLTAFQVRPLGPGVAPQVQRHVVHPTDMGPVDLWRMLVRLVG